MKKIYCLILVFSIISFVKAQQFQATIKSGTSPNSVILAIRPAADVISRKLSSLSLCVGVPATALPRPTVTIKNNLNTNISYEIQVSPNPENVPGKGQYFIYNLLGDGAQGLNTERTYTAGVDNNILEIEFSGGPLSGVSEILAVNLPSGGATQQTNFYIANQGIDVTNQTSMFYGAGATNGAGGYDGTSFVPVGNVTLPVKFLSFYALKNGDDAKLNWTVESDEDNKYFDVERSIDGRSFSQFVRVKAFENGKSVNTYDGIDSRLSSLGTKTVYYRIKQFDKSGASLYSPVRTLNISSTGATASLFPNPARTTSKLVVDAPNGGKASVILRDATGKQVMVVNTNFIKGINQMDLNVSALASGEYNVTILGEGLTQTIKLAKVN